MGIIGTEAHAYEGPEIIKTGSKNLEQTLLSKKAAIVCTKGLFIADIRKELKLRISLLKEPLTEQVFLFLFKERHGCS